MIVSMSLIVGFLVGAIAIVTAEGLALCWILRRLARKKRRLEETPPTGVDAGLEAGLDEAPLTFPCEKQGFVWVLEQDKFLMNLQHDPQEKGSRDQKKKEYVEVSPVKKKAEIKDGCLVLKDLDDFQTVIIQLFDCKIETISGSNFSSRKWMKSYPIKVESKTKIIYNGSKICYLYLETSWDKESWCKALRLASCSSMEKINWYTHLSKEFNCYLSSLTSEHPLFLKTSTVPTETTDEIGNMESNSSKVSHFFKKIARKASKIGSEYKSSTATSSNIAERKIREKNHQNVLYTSESTKSSSTEKSYLQHLLRTTSASSTLLKSQQIPACDEGWDEKYGFDECIFCLNLLLSRLFFDVKKSTEINNLIKERIQRTVSSIRTPTFVGGLHCIGLDLGSHPPYLHSVRALPMDMKEAWVVEVEIEYSGGILLEIETRLEVCEPEFKKGNVNTTSMEPNSAGEVASDLFDGFKTYNQELNTSNDSDDEMNRLNDGIKSYNGDMLRQSRNDSWTSSYKSRWKTILNSVLDHVSQVPISLEASVASIRGTLRLQVKPPPSDQIWISFTSMPEIKFDFNSAIGDYKIASTHLALLIGKRFKAAIREYLVLPNYECICIPWMLSEKDDWLPQNVAPFIWVRQESELTGKDSSRPQHAESKMKTDSYEESKTNLSHTFEHTTGEKTNAVSTHVSLVEPVLDDARPVAGPTPLLPSDLLTSNIEEPEDLGASRVSNDDTHGGTKQCRTDHSEPSRISSVPLYGKTSKPLEEETKSRKIRKRELIKDLGKKMSEKLDEKLRHTSSHVENVPSDTGSSIREFADETTDYKENGEDTMEKKMGKRELLKDLGKKMSEKFEEKMRHIEETGRHVIENVATDAGIRISVSADETTSNSSLEELKVPLLTDGNTQQSCDQDKTMSPQLSRTSTLTLCEQDPKSSEEDTKTRKIWRKESVWDLGKKMSDKLDEKRRHIEEKGRHIVEKMKENSRSSDGSGRASFIQKSLHKGGASFS